MKKVIKLLNLLVEKKVIASVLALLAVLVPTTAGWLKINSPAIVTSTTTILTTVAVVLAMYADKPFEKSDKANNGGTKK